MLTPLFRAVGLALAEAGVQTAELAYYTKRGERIWCEPRGRAAGYNWPQYSIPRTAADAAAGKHQKTSRLNNN